VVRRYAAQTPSRGIAVGGQLAGAVLLLPLLPFAPPAGEPTVLAISSLVALALSGNALGMVLYFRLIADIGATRALTVTYLMPAFALLWGALFLGAETHDSLISMIDGLIHESAHAHLFSLSLGESFVHNPDDERYPSPLRRDPRPLDGIFHAAYVCARMHYALSHAVEARVLTKGVQKEAQKALVASRTAFQDGFGTLNEHASLTPLGDRVIDSARIYMSGCY
jgi:hypothetical protein